MLAHLAILPLIGNCDMCGVCIREAGQTVMVTPGTQGHNYMFTFRILILVILQCRLQQCENTNLLVLIG